MKKQILALTGTLLLSSMTLASTLTCDITTGIIQDGLLYPGAKVTTVTTKLNESHTARDVENYLATCTKTKIQTLNILFCASKTEFLGILHAGINIEFASESETSTYADAQLGTLANGGQLGFISFTTAISPIIVKQFNEAGIEMPSEMKSDSYLVDEALKAGSKKGINLKDGEIVSLDIDNCKVN